MSPDYFQADEMILEVFLETNSERRSNELQIQTDYYWKIFFSMALKFGVYTTINLKIAENNAQDEEL